MNRIPDLFIVGAPKSGTTAMYAYLREHPDVFMPETKELRYFGSDLEIRDRPTRSLDDYLAHFAAAGDQRRIGTAYVWYLYSRRAAQEIHAFNPAARILVMLRNPLDMLPALHAEHLANGNEDIRDFTSALEAEPDRAAGRRIPPHAHLPQGLLYTTVPRYAEQLRRYLGRFGAERVHVIVFDDFVADVSAVYRRTLGFLELDPAFRPASFEVINANRRIRSEWLRHFLARPPELPRRVIHHLVPARLRRAIYDRAKGLNVTLATREPMSAATRERLRRAFEPEVEALSALLDRDLTHWVRRAEPASTERREGAPAHTR